MEHAAVSCSWTGRAALPSASDLPQFQSHETAVIVDIEPQGDGCQLTLRHDMGPADEETREMLERAEEGWSMVLANLERALKG